jgi:hypothetical protein
MCLTFVKEGVCGLKYSCRAFGGAWSTIALRRHQECYASHHLYLGGLYHYMCSFNIHNIKIDLI